MRILIVEDNLDILETLSHYLMEMGHDTTQAADVAQAVKALEKPFDLVITDYQLPDGDGSQVGKLAREVGCTRVFLHSGNCTLCTDPHLFDRVFDKMSGEMFKHL